MKKPPALLLIDLQNDFFPGGPMALEGMEAAAAVAACALAEFRARDWPRFHVQHVSTRAGATFFLAGSPGVEIPESVCPGDEEPVVIKHFPNAFRDTMLFDELWQAGAGELVICAARVLAFGERRVAAADVHAAFMAALASYARVCTFDEWHRKLEPAALAA